MKKMFVGGMLVLAILIGYKIINQTENRVENQELKIEVSPTKAEVKIEVKKIEIKNFPFTVQAPNGDWGNPIFQDGCEEASTLMIKCALNSDLCLVKSGVIDKEWAAAEIIRISGWEKETYGSSTDTSAKDTAKRLLGDINYEVKELKSSEELKNGVWIFPMDGRKLGNPYYTAPGPERHMILVIGYDSATDEVITNDAGTKRGKGYRYDRKIFWEAIRDYPTGDHEPIIGIEKKGILISGGE